VRPTPPVRRTPPNSPQASPFLPAQIVRSTIKGSQGRWCSFTGCTQAAVYRLMHRPERYEPRYALRYGGCEDEMLSFTSFTRFVLLAGCWRWTRLRAPLSGRVDLQVR
jgi:hypothetical protein